MDQDKQTLLEAARAFIGDDWNGIHLRNLRAAIAREDAKPADGRSWQVYAQESRDRAQQAEADAAWHRAESARLSAELAKEREENRHDSGYLARVREDVGVHPLDTVHSLRQRAEKAEAELAEAKQARQLDRAVDVLTRIEPRDPTTGFTFATYRRVVEALGGKS